VLIVDDEPSLLEVIVEAVGPRGMGCRVLSASNIAQARRVMTSQPIELLVADLNLPDGTGMDVLADIRSRCTTPVIMVTGENVGHIAAEAIRKGATDYVVKVGDYLFTIPLVIEKNLTVAALIKEKEELRRQLEEKNAQLEQMAATDALTGVYNRRHFSRVIDQLFAEAQRYDKDLACVMIDLDGYKQLNDTMGHQVGDQLLVMAGKVISASMRRMDVAARYGGDEFVLLLPQASTEEASLAAQRIREEYFAASAALLKRKDGVTMSIGIAALRQGVKCASNAEQLVAHADAALYKSKQDGRNRISVAGCEQPLSEPPAAIPLPPESPDAPREGVQSRPRKRARKSA